YHLPIAFEVRGRVNVQALTSAFHFLLERHETLRTVVEEVNYNQYQRLLPTAEWKLNLLEGDGHLDKINELIQLPFDLSKDFMLKSWLITQSEERHLLLVIIHHIAFDAWSKQIFLQELWSAYEAYNQGVSLSLPPLDIRYSDYALWQKSEEHQTVIATKLKYWKRKLDDVSPLQLPKDFHAGGSILVGDTRKYSIYLCILRPPSCVNMCQRPLRNYLHCWRHFMPFYIAKALKKIFAWEQPSLKGKNRVQKG